MGYYKVPQDVEAEDKLLGPFTFKQFLFLIAMVISAFVAFQLAATVNIIAALPVLPIVFVTGLVALYHPKDQPVENKVIAYLNFTFKPRRRVWSRDGIVEQVNIKAPKKIEHDYTDGRSQEQVRSQLKQLAQIVDTRGWASKRADIQEPVGVGLSGDDRLIQPSDVTTVYDNPVDDLTSDDIYDNTSNPVAQAFGQQTNASEEQARQELIERLRQQAQEEASQDDEKSEKNKQPTYVNPYSNDSESNAPAQNSKKDQKVLRERIKELEKNEELSVSSIAARAQEMQVDHKDDPSELTIQH